MKFAQDAEIEKKGREIMEEYRKDRGHWQFLQNTEHINHMVDHIGANGIAVAGFFIDKKIYRDTEPGPATQEQDPLFRQFKALAKDQSWAHDLGMSHKTWSFGYGHDKSIAQEAGCDDIGTWLWDHCCVVVWKTSEDGSSIQTHATTHFGNDHSKGITATPAQLRQHIVAEAGKKVVNPSSAEL